MSTTAAAEPPLSPLIASHLNHLLQNSSLSIKVDQIWAGSKNARFSDRFSLAIPFCLDYVKWDVIYNAMQPSAAPDIVFSLEDDDFDPLSEINDGQRAKESSLSEWNCKDPTKLMALVHEIRELYMHYQRKRVADLDDPRLKFEISTMLPREGIEVCMISSPDRPEEVKFAVPLLVDIDINKMVPACYWRQQQKIHLQVIFPVSRIYSSSPSAPRVKLVSTSELKVFLPIEDVKLPPWLDGMCMAEYLPAVEDSLKTQMLYASIHMDMLLQDVGSMVRVVEAVASIGARRRFIEALAPLFGRPLEADPVFCRRATILSASGIFTFLVHFSIPIQFPKQQPTLVMQSSQHFTSQGLPISSAPITDYPWSPRWDPQLMAERIFDYLVDECLNFKKFCMEAIPQSA